MQITRSYESQESYLERNYSLLNLGISSVLHSNHIETHRICFDIESDNFLYIYHCLQIISKNVVAGEYHYRKINHLFAALQDRDQNIFMSQETANKLIAETKEKIRITQLMISNNHFDFLNVT